MERQDNYALAAGQARQLFANYDHRALAQKLGARLDDGYLYTRMLSRPYRIECRTGDISVYTGAQWQAVTGFNETLTLLDLVCDSSEHRCISGRWKSLGAFGLQFHQNLLEQADPWAQYLQDNPARLEAACRRLNGKRYPLGDCAYVIPLFEELGVMLQLWYSDEEFPASVRWLWDENAKQYLKYETMYYAISMIRAALDEEMKRLP